MLWDLFERFLDRAEPFITGKVFIITLLICSLFLYGIGWQGLIFGVFFVLMLLKILCEMPDGAGLLIGWSLVGSLVMFFIPLTFLLINLIKG